MPVFISYDIPSIQKFIFSVPKLKCIIGASSQVVAFDEFVSTEFPAEAVFAGGGKGTLECDEESRADDIQKQLVARARACGMSIRFGKGDSAEEAPKNQFDAYYFAPTDQQEGNFVPCRVSGLYPVAKSSPTKEVHPIIESRIKDGRNDELGRKILESEILKACRNELVEKYSFLASDIKFEFVKNVSIDPEDLDVEGELKPRKNAALTAIGNRNRWAIVTMDGNSVGKLFHQLSNAEFKALSAGLKQVTETALAEAIKNVLEKWFHDFGQEAIENCSYNKGTKLVLPFRPLILGGDDVTIIVHSDYAMTFASQMATSFQEGCLGQAWLKAPLNHREQQTGIGNPSDVTMSAGILHCSTSFPLHKAIDYAGELLDNTKKKFRQENVAGVDWDSITNSLVESVEAKRNRNFRFIDADFETETRVELTGRPYKFKFAQGPELDVLQLEECVEKFQSKKISRSVLSRLQYKLRAPRFERLEFLSAIGKRHPYLMEMLWDWGEQGPGAGWTVYPGKGDQPNVISTHVLDVISLMDESKRMDQNTAQSGA